MTMNNIDKTISVVVPVYNSKSTIDELIKRLTQTLSCFKDYSIVLVNDNSNDNSFEIIKEYTKYDNHIIAISLKENMGQQRATFLGLQYAHGDFVAIIDDDLAQNPEDIILLYSQMQKGYDVVYGINKNDIKRPFIRGLGSRIRNMMFNSITNKAKDTMVSSFRIVNSDTHKKILEANTKYIYISMEILKYTSNIGNIYVDYHAGGHTNYSTRKLVALVVNMYIYYSKQKIIRAKQMPADTYKIAEIINGDII